MFSPIEQEIDEGLSRVDESECAKKGLMKQRSLSLSSKYTISHQISIQPIHQQRPESGSLLQDLKSISSGKINRRESSTG